MVLSIFKVCGAAKYLLQSITASEKESEGEMQETGWETKESDLSTRSLIAAWTTAGDRAPLFLMVPATDPLDPGASVQPLTRKE